MHKNEKAKTVPLNFDFDFRLCLWPKNLITRLPLRFVPPKNLSNPAEPIFCRSFFLLFEAGKPSEATYELWRASEGSCQKKNKKEEKLLAKSVAPFWCHFYAKQSPFCFLTLVDAVLKTHKT